VTLVAGVLVGMCLHDGSVLAANLTLSFAGTDINGAPAPNYPAMQSGASGPLTGSGSVGVNTFVGNVDYGSMVLSGSTSTNDDNPFSFISAGSWLDTITFTGAATGSIGFVQFLFTISGTLAASDSDGTAVGSAFGAADWNVDVSLDGGVGFSSIAGTLGSNTGASGSAFGDFATAQMNIEFGTAVEFEVSMSAAGIAEPDFDELVFETASASVSNLTLTYTGLIVRNFGGDMIGGAGVSGGSGFDWAVVPEPSRALMMGLGIFGVVLRRRRFF
jgi:hypothetical protein